MSRAVDRRLLAVAPSLRPLLAAITVLRVVAASSTVAQACALAAAIDGLVHADVRTSALTLLVVAVIVRGVADAAHNWCAERGAHRVRGELRAAVLDAARRLGPGWAARQPSGRLITAAGTGLEALDGYVTRALPAFVAATVVPPAALIWLALTDWRSALVVVVLLPLVPLFMALVGRTTARRTRRQYALLARLSGHFLDLLAGLTTLRIYGAAERQVEAVRASTEAYRRRTMATLRAAFLSGLVLDLLATLSVAVIAVEIGLRVDHGSVSLATALVVLLLLPELFAPLRAVGTQYHAAESGRTAVEAALAVIDEGAQGEPVPPPATVGDRGAVQLHRVQVQYPDRDTPALDGLDLRVAPGEIVALSGRSGAGKSTLLHCVLGFVAPTAGRVEIGGVARSVAWVPQRPRPTQTTVAAEVALGDPHATPDDIAAVLATCHAPLADTALGEGGLRLSAGQRRRVALARALLRARAAIAAGAVPVLLLDEPSEDLDDTTEQVVVSVVAELAGRATVLLASHSAVMLGAADRVVTLEAGRVRSVTVQRPVRGTVPPNSGPVAVTEPGEHERARPTTRRTLIARARTVVGAGLVSGLAGLAGLALTACSIWLLCRASQHPNIQALEVAVVGVRTFALARALLRYLERLRAHDAALRVLTDVRVRVFQALVPLVPNAARLRRGDLLRRFVVDVDSVQDGLVGAVVPIIGAAATALGALTLATVLAPAAGFALTTGLAVAAVIVPAVSWAAAGPAAPIEAASGRRDTATTTLLDGLGELTAYGADGDTAATVRAGDRLVAQRSLRRETVTAAAAAVTSVVVALTLAAALRAAVSAVRSGAVSGVAAAVIAACVLAGFEAAATVTPALLSWTRFRSCADRVAQVLDASPAVPEPAHPQPVPDGVEGAVGVVVRAAAIAPAAELPAALSDVDLALPAGRRVAVVGASGSGKSTLLAAVLRLAPVLSGSVSVGPAGDEVDVRELPSAGMPGLVAGSLQGDHVFDATLRDNLRVVRPGASDEDLDEVARQAGLTDVVGALPDGWSTPAGPDGAALSGGQRQRLLLARALLADPEVLVLDEPTAHLDDATAGAVLTDVLAGTAGRTVLLTTHRPLPPGVVDDVVAIDGRDQRPGAIGPSPSAAGHPTGAGSIPDKLEVGV